MAETGLSRRGGGFLLQSPGPGEIFTPEQFGQEQLMIGRTAEKFIVEKVRPQIEALEAGDHSVSVQLLREAGDLGLLAADIPEAYGGLGLTKTTSTLITEKTAQGLSFLVTFQGHVGIGTLPIVYFGSEEQKRRYLPDLATGTKLAAYALTEPEAGSDARGGKTSATLAPDGQGYLLKGQKQWITNAGFADVFVAYAKVDGDKMTAFIVDRDTPGLSVGPEFHKMGIQGSSTCTLYFENALVPSKNLLGETGRGHIIAFNVLNFGRWKLAAGCVGSCKHVLGVSARYAAQRRQFGRPIADYPAIQQKLARMASRTFALESLAYRTAGLWDAGLATLQASTGEAAARAIGEYAIEASISKVFGSETLDYVVDEGVQVHGGYGYMHGADVERAYRDSRITRIFEGTNEINRMLVSETLLRRAVSGDLPLLAQGRPQPGKAAPDGPLAAETGVADDIARAAVFLLASGAQRWGMAIAGEQEFLLAAADLVILAYASQSAALRARRMAADGHSSAEVAAEMVSLFCAEAAAEAHALARQAAAGMASGEALERQLAMVEKLLAKPPVNTTALGRSVARRVLEAGGYPVVSASS